MTSDRLLNVALKHFAQNGYEGASLADISADVGIKKQSIYNHFKGKDELFLTVFWNATLREMLFMEEYLKRNKILQFENMLYGFLKVYQKRYELEDDTKFYLRTVFFPPNHLEKEIVDYSNEHVKKSGALFERIFGEAAKDGVMHPDVSPRDAAFAFLAILDGMLVEMLYGNVDRSIMIVDASWHIYWRGIRNN